MLTKKIPKHIHFTMTGFVLTGEFPQLNSLLS